MANHRPKQRACIACINAKRSCDRTLPSCERCLGRAIDCEYPTTTKRRQHRTAATGSPRWRAILSTSETAHATSTLSASPSPPVSSWFLDPTTWLVTHSHSNGAILNPPPVSDFQNFVRGLQSWLVRFLRDGHNPFIHHSLYSEAPVPQCIRDAYSSIAISHTSTARNEHLVRDILSTNISNLVNSQPDPVSVPVLSTGEHLARTQALLIHLVLALFSSSIPGRAEAETLIPTLRLWSQQLWDSALLDVQVSSFAPSASVAGSSWSTVDLDNEPELPASMYRAFVISESIRRTWLVVHFAIGAYQALKANHTTCGGGIPFTARAGIWDAPSPARWECLAKSTDPLFIQSFEGDAIIRRGVPAVDVDEFARHLFTLKWGVDKIETWTVQTGDDVPVMFEG